MMKNKTIERDIVIKGFDEEQRRIYGVASTPSLDRQGDILNPNGVKYNLPIPLLWNHNSNNVVGQVVDAKATTEGIEFEAQFAKIGDDAPELQDEINKFWQKVKYGLVKSVSVGFVPNEYEETEKGWLVNAWEWIELSICAIGANPDAKITTVVKAVEAGGADLAVPELTQTKEVRPVMNILEQIRSFEEQKEVKLKEIDDIMNKTLEEGRIITDSEDNVISQLKKDIDGIERHLSRVKEMGEMKKKAAVPLESEKVTQETYTAPAFIKAEPKLEKGIEFARFVKCLSVTRGNRLEALEVAKNVYHDNKRLHHVIKAAINAGTTTDPKWAGALVEYTTIASDFIDFLRPQTIIGKFGNGGIPSLRRVPFNIRVNRQTSGGSGYWVGQGKAKPLTKFAFDQITLGFAKVANIAVLTDELVRFSNPSADMLVRNELAAALIERLDIDFIDPKKNEVEGISPASITNGSQDFVSTKNPEQDYMNLINYFIDNNMTLNTAVWIMSAKTAMQLSLIRNPLGAKLYPDMNMTGGMWQGLPVIVSEYVGNNLVLMNANEVYLADDGSVVIDASREASLEMDDAPKGDSITPTGASLVSMWQTNSVAIRAERFINWKRRRDEGVAIVTGVDYSITAGS